MIYSFGNKILAGMYFTEFSGGGWNTNYADVLTSETRLIFIGQTKSWAKNVLLWNLALDEHYGPKVVKAVVFSKVYITLQYQKSSCFNK